MLCSNPSGKSHLFLFLTVLSISIYAPTWATGQGTGESELTAVILVEGIYPGNAIEMTLLHIKEVGEATYPSEEELLQAVTDAYADDPMAPNYYHHSTVPVGNYQLFWAEPMDFGAVTLVDIRDGAVAFAGQQVWMGFGSVIWPPGSSHDWLWEEGQPASEPELFQVIHNFSWSDEYFGNQDYYLQTALDLARQTDVLRSFGSCGPYQVTAYLHTPAVGMTQPEYGVAVLIINGHAAPPWGPEPVDTRGLTMSLLKSFYR